MDASTEEGFDPESDTTGDIESGKEASVADPKESAATGINQHAITHASLATVHLQPLHHPALFLHVSLDRKFRIACIGVLGNAASFRGDPARIGNRSVRISNPVAEVAESRSNLHNQPKLDE